MEMITSSKQHAALLCSPGMGHLIPVLELGKRLVTHQNFTVTIFVISSHTSDTESQLINTAANPKLCRVVDLPPPDISGLVGPDAAVVTILAVMMREVRHAFRSALRAMEFCPTVLIVDLFGTESFSIADEFGIPKYVYIPSSAWFLSFMIYGPTLDLEVKGEFTQQKKPIKIPGCRSILPQLDVVDSFRNRTHQQYFDFVEICSQTSKGDGVLVNIWEDLEPNTLAALREREIIGPLNESVIYVSFGSGGTLSFEQMTELAWGLELSQQRFIWVIRPPTLTADGAFFTGGSSSDDNNPIKYLPNGFLDRTKDIGLVIPFWAPQVDILSHPAVGGFLSHCGWNSTLESITNGVPMITWPLYAEQRMNATLLTEELGVAVRSMIPPWKKVVEREEIEEMVRKIMEDKEGFALRDRVKKIKESGAKALEKGGSSYNALSQFAKHSELMCMKFVNGGE
ncbi:hypothetical protein ACFX2J_026926 [Malus domestica]